MRILYEYHQVSQGDSFFFFFFSGSQPLMASHLPCIPHIRLQMSLLAFDVQTQDVSSLGRHANVHERRVAPAGTQHVEGHEQKRPGQVERRVLKHLVKGHLASLRKVPGRDGSV